MAGKTKRRQDAVGLWEKNIYGQGKQLNKYTWGEVYYYTNRYFLSQTGLPKKPRVMELGSGAGNNLTYYASLGMDVCGIEASETACRVTVKALKKYKGIKKKIICGDFCRTPLPFEPGSFDLIVDRGSMTHNPSTQIKKVIDDCYRMLKPGGLILSIHFFSDKDSRFGRGKEVSKNTFKDIGGRTFADVPVVHFSNLKEIKELYRKYEILFVEEHTSERSYPYKSERSVSFDIIARKPAKDQDEQSR